jgi:hypothetical protein
MTYIPFQVKTLFILKKNMTYTPFLVKHLFFILKGWMKDRKVTRRDEWNSTQKLFTEGEYDLYPISI